MPSVPMVFGAEITLPAVGFGTGGLKGSAGVDALTRALEVGYRLVDSAVNYENEGVVGHAVRQSSVPREEILVTSKLPGRHHGYDEAIATIEESVYRTGLDYLDLYLIHWPNPHVDRYVESWRAMIELRELGLVRSIGVSNFCERHLLRLVDETGERPIVNQVELHPGWRQEYLRATHADLGITTMAWSPFGAALEDPVVRDIAKCNGWTPAETLLRWHASLGVIPMPRSSDPLRQKENLAVRGVLAAEDTMALSTLSQQRLWGGDPETFRDE
jgi:2,5-diketo-D-gluconate reductase A